MMQLNPIGLFTVSVACLQCAAAHPTLRRTSAAVADSTLILADVTTPWTCNNKRHNSTVEDGTLCTLNVDWEGRDKDGCMGDGLNGKGWCWVLGASLGMDGKVVTGADENWGACCDDNILKHVKNKTLNITEPAAAADRLYAEDSFADAVKRMYPRICDTLSGAESCHHKEVGGECAEGGAIGTCRMAGTACYCKLDRATTKLTMSDGSAIPSKWLREQVNQLKLALSQPSEGSTDFTVSRESDVGSCGFASTTSGPFTETLSVAFLGGVNENSNIYYQCLSESLNGTFLFARKLAGELEYEDVATAVTPVGNSGSLVMMADDGVALGAFSGVQMTSLASKQQMLSPGAQESKAMDYIASKDSRAVVKSVFGEGRDAVGLAKQYIEQADEKSNQAQQALRIAELVSTGSDTITKELHRNTLHSMKIGLSPASLGDTVFAVKAANQQEGQCLFSASPTTGFGTNAKIKIPDKGVEGRVYYKCSGLTSSLVITITQQSGVHFYAQKSSESISIKDGGRLSFVGVQGRNLTYSNETSMVLTGQVYPWLLQANIASVGKSVFVLGTAKAQPDSAQITFSENVTDGDCKFAHTEDGNYMTTMDVTMEDKEKTVAVFFKCMSPHKEGAKVTVLQKSGTNNYTSFATPAIIVGALSPITVRALVPNSTDEADWPVSVIKMHETRLVVKLGVPSLGLTRVKVAPSSENGNCKLTIRPAAWDRANAANIAAAAAASGVSTGTTPPTRVATRVAIQASERNLGATAAAPETTLSGMIKMMKPAEKNKSPEQHVETAWQYLEARRQGKRETSPPSPSEQASLLEVSTAVGNTLTCNNQAFSSQEPDGSQCLFGIDPASRDLDGCIGTGYNGAGWCWTQGASLNDKGKVAAAADAHYGACCAGSVSSSTNVPGATSDMHPLSMFKPLVVVSFAEGESTNSTIVMRCLENDLIGTTITATPVQQVHQYSPFQSVFFGVKTIWTNDQGPLVGRLV